MEGPLHLQSILPEPPPQMKENLGRANPTPDQGFFPRKSIQVDPSKTTAQEIKHEPGDTLLEADPVEGIKIAL